MKNVGVVVVKNVGVVVVKNVGVEEVKGVVILDVGAATMGVAVFIMTMKSYTGIVHLCVMEVHLTEAGTGDVVEQVIGEVLQEDLMNITGKVLHGCLCLDTNRRWHHLYVIHKPLSLPFKPLPHDVFFKFRYNIRLIWISNFLSKTDAPLLKLISWIFFNPFLRHSNLLLWILRLIECIAWWFVGPWLTVDMRN